MNLRVNGRTRNTVSAVALAASLLLPTTVAADEVTLKSADGTVNLVGEFIEFSNGNYVIRTELGDLRISASRVGCVGDACPLVKEVNADVTIAGADTVGVDILPLLLSGYAGFLGAEAQLETIDGGGEVVAKLVGDEGFGDPIATYVINSSQSSDAFRKLLDRSAQIGMSARRIRPDEARALRDDGAGNMIAPENEHVIALKSLVVITHPDNPVNDITTDALQQIYRGDITNWAELGGADAPISVFSHAEGTSARAIFETKLFDEDAGRLPTGASIAADDSRMAAAINNDVNAIGYVGYAFQRGAKPLTLINECGLGMSPDAFSVRAAEYGLQQNIYLYNRADTRSDEVSAFIDFARSAAADEVIIKAGFVDLGVARQKQSSDDMRAKQLDDSDVDPFEGNLMREMRSEMDNFDRLSSTFRFRTGSSRLTPRGERDLARLASYLETQPDGTKVLFVGFTDDVGAFESNRQLSIGRAQQVQQALEELAGDRLDGISLDANGFGEIAPSACNTTDLGRGINRRVEVWIQSPES